MISFKICNSTCTSVFCFKPMWRQLLCHVVYWYKQLKNSLFKQGPLYVSIYNLFIIFKVVMTSFHVKYFLKQMVFTFWCSNLVLKNVGVSFYLAPHFFFFTLEATFSTCLSFMKQTVVNGLSETAVTLTSAPEWL